MLNENAYRDSVRERDLDNFLVEELTASDDFRDWLLGRISADFLPPDTGDIWVEKSPPRTSPAIRQTDVEMCWLIGDDKQASVIFESKVDDNFGVGQAEAYRVEVQAKLSEMGPKRAASVLVAPARKMAVLQHDGAFAANVAIEEIITFLEDRLEELEEGELSRRLAVRIELLQALVGKRNSGSWVTQTIPEKKLFGSHYDKLAPEFLPGLSVNPSSHGPKVFTRSFSGMNIPELPDMTLRHEYGNNKVWKYTNVQFSDRADYVDRMSASGLLEGTPFYVKPAGKTSLSIRATTPGINPMLPFEDEREKVEEGLNATRDLLAWVRANAAEIARILEID